MSKSKLAGSNFVTGTAWSFIILGGLMAIVNTMQLAFIASTYSSADLGVLARDIESANLLPVWMVFIMKHLLAWISLMLLLSLTTVAAAIGLLLRKNWARLVFVVMMWIGAAWNLVGMLTPLHLRAFLDSMLQSVPIDSRAEIESTAVALAWVAAGVALAFALLFAWAAIRLSSQQIREEFVPLE